MGVPPWGVRYAETMEVQFPPELEERLAQSAARVGCTTADLVEKILSRYFDDEVYFLEAVKRGETALDRGEFLSHDEVGGRLERFLRH